jgi:beta-glucosidase
VTMRFGTCLRFSAIFILLSLTSGTLGEEFASVRDIARLHPELWPKASSPASFIEESRERQITALMASMSLDEKVGQTIQADISSIRPDDLRRYPLGALLAGGNSAPGRDLRAPPGAWLALVKAYQDVATEAREGHIPIPLLFGVDAVHGDSKIRGATIFPHNIGLGAAHDPELMRLIGEATAEEVAATGFNWTFAPTLATPRDIHWGRSYEGYGEEPELAARYAAPMTLGLQGDLRAGRSMPPNHILATAKHFVADGGAAGGIDQGDARISESELIRLHAGGYPPAIEAGVLSVMASFSSWNGVKHSGNRSLLTDVLKGRLGFEGFVVGDWNAHGQLPGCVPDDCPQAMNAGIDLYMAPDSWKGLFENTLAAVRSGRISMQRLDDAVRRILRAKIIGGLFDGLPANAGRFERLGAPSHREIARRAVRESIVLLKNNKKILPLLSSARILVTGDGADNIGKQSGGWTLNWQGIGNANSDFPNGQSIYAGLKEALGAGGGSVELSADGDFTEIPDAAIVVFGENPYAEFQGDLDSLEFEAGDQRNLSILRRLKAKGIPVVAVFLSGRPLWTNPHINASDAFVAAWLPGSEGGGIADVLIGDANGRARYDFRGKLTFSWPARADRIPGHRDEDGYAPQFPFGYGLTYLQPVELPLLSEDPGVRTPARNVERYFVNGREQPPWRLHLNGAAAQTTVDAGAQENGRRIDWSGDGDFAVTGPVTDLSRQATGDMAVLIRYRIESSPTRPVLMSVSCGADCKGTVDISALLADSAVKEWRVARIKLSCFRRAGADLSRVTSPLTLSTSGAFSMTVTELRLASHQGEAICPTQ